MWNSAKSWIRKYPEIAAGIAYLTLTLLCFFPLVNSTASLSWDASDLWLPWKHFISEELYNGHLPLWNPYHVNGFPQHGDSMTWYPLSWLFAFLNGQYNLSALNQEYLFHIFVAGLAFYRFSGNFVQSQKIRFLLGLSYMLSGFMIGNAQHVSWIISAAWMPLVFHYLLQILRHQDKAAIFKLALTGFFFFSGGYLAIFFVAVYIILIGLAVYIYQNRDWQKLRPAFISLGMSFALIILLSLPLLLSAWNIFPLFNRFDPSDPNFNLNTGAMPVNGVLAIILPLASGIYNINEIEFGSFSAYFGLIPFILLCFYGKQLLRQPKIALLTGLAIFFLLCSLGDLLPLRNIVSKLPLLDLFRYPSLFRLFFIFFLLLAVGMIADQCIIDFSRRQLLWLSAVVGGIGIIILFSAWSKFDFAQIKAYFKDYKYFRPLENLHIFNRIFINLLLILGGLLLINLWARFRKAYPALLFAWGLELVLIACSSAPHTVYHPVNVDFSNGILAQQPQNYAPVHRNHYEKERQNWDGYLDFSWQGKTFFLKQWSKNWYNPLKLNYKIPSPYRMTDEEAENAPLFSIVSFGENKLDWLIRTGISAEIKSSSEIHFRVKSPLSNGKKTFFLVKQNLVPEWKAFSGKKEVKIQQSQQGFMLLPLDKNTQELTLKYDNAPYKIAFTLFCLTLCIVLIILFMYSPHKVRIAVGSILVITIIACNSWERLSSAKEIANPEKFLRITAKDLDNSEQFRAIASWKNPQDLLLIQNYPKTDSDLSYFRYFYPEQQEMLTYKGQRYTRFTRGTAKASPFYTVRDTIMGSNFALDLLSWGKIKNKILCLRMDYTAPNATPLNLWIAQLRDGKMGRRKKLSFSCGRFS